jgi:uncharacterized protein YpmB
MLTNRNTRANVRSDNIARFTIHNEMDGMKIHDFDLEKGDELYFDAAGGDQSILSNSVYLYWFVPKRDKIFRVKLFDGKKYTESASTTIEKVTKIVSV